MRGAALRVAAVAGAMALAGAVSDAVAQSRGGGFLEFLFGGGASRGAPAPVAAARGAPIPPPPPPGFTRFYIPGPWMQQPEDTQPRGPSRVYCVRTCDGFLFPLSGRAVGLGRDEQQFLCKAFCPGAATEIYSGSAPEDAVGPKGKKYASLANAFDYRETTKPGCFCRADGGLGLASLPVEQDRTLRAGDIVVTPQGVRVFRGGERFPYRNSDFADYRSVASMPADLRARLSVIERGAKAQPGTPPATARVPAAERRPLAIVVRPDNVAETSASAATASPPGVRTVGPAFPVQRQEPAASLAE